MNKSEKISFLKAIYSGRKSIHELSKVINVSIWKQLLDKPNYYINIVTKRICSIYELRIEYSNNKKKGVSPF